MHCRLKCVLCDVGVPINAVVLYMSVICMCMMLIRMSYDDRCDGVVDRVSASQSVDQCSFPKSSHTKKL